MKPIPQLIATAYLPDQLLDLKAPAVLMVGRSNVGKSSLINALCDKPLARTAKAPGKTRSVNYYQLPSGLILADLPGYGYARVSRANREAWKELLYEFFETCPGGTHALLLVDARRELAEEEHMLLAAFAERGIACRILLTKADRLGRAERAARERRLRADLEGEEEGIPLTCGFVSAKTGEGVDALRRQLLRYGQKI
jgi:GTP-binding protein